jgi:hypothetical protein
VCPGLCRYSSYVGAPYLIANVGSSSTRFGNVKYIALGVSLFFAVVLTILFVVLTVFGDVYMNRALAKAKED